MTQVEGTFEGRRQASAFARGDRAVAVRHKDNLKMEGDFEVKKTEAAFTRGERAAVKKHEDNLKLVRGLGDFLGFCRLTNFLQLLKGPEGSFFKTRIGANSCLRHA
jgi:hypothetical protein